MLNKKNFNFLKFNSKALCPSLPGDHKEVPDPVPAARGRISQRNHQQGAKHHLVPAEQHRCGLQRGRLHSKILCLQLSGTHLWAQPLPGDLKYWRNKTESQDRQGFKRADLFPQTVYAVPILTFAFVCHPAILPMYEELKEWVFTAFRSSHLPRNHLSKLKRFISTFLCKLYPDD